MAMNTNVLLQQEIKVLLAENERKMKKKARTRATLGNDLIYLYRKVKIVSSSLIHMLRSRLRSRHLGLASELQHAAVVVGLLNIP